MSENQEDLVTPSNQRITGVNEPEEDISANKNNVVSLASKQIRNVIEFQEPSTSTNYSFKTEIRINILGEPKSSQRSIDTDDSVTLSLFNEDRKPKKEPVELEESFTTMDNCVKEKMTNTNEPTRLNRNPRTQQTVVGHSEAPPPYHSSPPPPYSTSRYQSSAPEHRQITSSDQEDGYFYFTQEESSFLNIQIRHTFIQRVFMILFVQLMVTVGTVLLGIYHKPTKRFMKENVVMAWVMFALFFVTYIILGCFSTTRRKFPWNFILLSLFTISLSYICAASTVYFDTNIVLTTVIGTALICLAVTILAFQTWFDITKWSFILSLAGIIVVLFGIAMMFVSLFMNIPILFLVYSGVVVVLFSVYLLYDMQLILGGRRYELSTDEYIFGAISLFVDIVMIFMHLLYIVGAIRS